MDLTFAETVPRQEKILIRSGELAGVSGPGVGDYLREEATGVIWDVMGSRMDVTGEYWLFQAVRSANLDWGALTAAAQHEDWGLLT